MAQDRRLLFLLARAARTASARVSAITQERLGVSVTQLGTLSYVAEHPGCSMSEAADVLDLNKSAMSGMVSRLERAGLLRREPDGRDGRVTRLYLTDEGAGARVASRPVFRRAIAEMTAGFSERELEVVFRFLNALVDAGGADSDEPG